MSVSANARQRGDWFCVRSAPNRRRCPSAMRNTTNNVRIQFKKKSKRAWTSERLSERRQTRKEKNKSDNKGKVDRRTSAAAALLAMRWPRTRQSAPARSSMSSCFTLQSYVRRSNERPRTNERFNVDATQHPQLFPVFCPYLGGVMQRREAFGVDLHNERTMNDQQTNDDE